jgi:ribosomal protein S18 acetylase RimI-like enzyme
MNDRLDGSPIEYSVYVPSQAEEMTRLLADAFAHHEGLSVAAGLSEAQFAMFVRTFLPQVAEEKLTIVARFADSGEMVGALLTNDPTRETAPSSETLHEKFGPVAGILGQLVATYKAGREPRPGEMLHLYLLGVSDRVAGRGIGQQLVSACVENGARRGYQVAFAEAAGRASQHIFRKLGFAERAYISYQDYVFNGRKVFESIAYEGGPTLMEKLLTPASALCHGRA